MSVQWLGALDKIEIFPLFLRTFESRFANKWTIKFLRRRKGEHLRFPELKKSSNVLKETDERAYTTANVKLTTQSA